VKTTVEISDALFREAKRYAKDHDVTFRELLERSIQGLIAKNNGPRKIFRLKRCSFRGDGLVGDYSWPEVRAQIYEGRGE
jgi:hypothetical protein